HVVDRLGEEEAADEGNCKGDERLDQPRAQLDQVLHQRRFGRLDFLIFVLAAHAGLPSGLATSAAGGGSLVAGAGGSAHRLGGWGRWPVRRFLPPWPAGLWSAPACRPLRSRSAVACCPAPGGPRRPDRTRHSSAPGWSCRRPAS